jgi:hypothetical protein
LLDPFQRRASARATQTYFDTTRQTQPSRLRTTATMWPFDAVDWVMLSVPLAYLFILVGSLYTFSTIYRKRKIQRAASLEPWFPPHLQRNVYLSLLHQEDPKVPDSILKAALLRRATEDISRIIQVRSQKQALQVLLQRGSVGDDLWQRFQRAEKEIEDELRDVVQEVWLLRAPRFQSTRLTIPRQTHSHPTGASPSSNPHPSSRKTTSSASVSTKSSPPLTRSGNGGTSVDRKSNLNCWGSWMETRRRARPKAAWRAVSLVASGAPRRPAMTMRCW